MESYNEVFGTLEKLEELSVIKTNIINGSLVFESLAPFWDYYDESPSKANPLYIYIGMEQNYDVFEITRASEKIRTNLEIRMDAAKATLAFNDRFFHVIRLRHIKGYEQIREIQEQYSLCGIKPALVNGNWKNQVVKVQFRKIFYLSMMDDGIFFDNNEKHHYYIEVPKALSFDDFFEVTQKVKNNWIGHKFDAALGAYLYRSKVCEMVRIYSEMISLKDLKEIQKLFHHKMK
jgi:hypothetical protein